MKKLLSIAFSLVLLISCFAVSASAESVNVAEGKVYAYLTDVSTRFYSSGANDSACTLLTDGDIPTFENSIQSVSFSGSGNAVSLVIDLGAVYSDINAINFCCVGDSLTDGTAGANRGFNTDVLMIELSADGVTYTRYKDYDFDRVKINPDNANDSHYNFNFNFDDEQTAKSVRITMVSQSYILTLGEIQVMSASGVGQEPEEPSSEEESSEEDPVDDTTSEEEPSDDATSDDATSDDATSNDATSNDETSEDKTTGTTSSKADESKADDSKDDTSATSSDDEGSLGIGAIVGISAAVIVVVAIVVVVLLSKKKNNTAA